jgi:hypothetical protein
MNIVLTAGSQSWREEDRMTQVQRQLGQLLELSGLQSQDEGRGAASCTYGVVVTTACILIPWEFSLSDLASCSLSLLTVYTLLFHLGLCGRQYTTFRGLTLVEALIMELLTDDIGHVNSFLPMMKLLTLCMKIQTT